MAKDTRVLASIIGIYEQCGRSVAIVLMTMGMWLPWALPRVVTTADNVVGDVKKKTSLVIALTVYRIIL